MMFLKKTIFCNVSLETLKICPLTSTLIRVSVVYLSVASPSVASSKTSSSSFSFLSRLIFFNKKIRDSFLLLIFLSLILFDSSCVDLEIALNVKAADMIEFGTRRMRL